MRPYAKSINPHAIGLTAAHDAKIAARTAFVNSPTKKNRAAHEAAVNGYVSALNDSVAWAQQRDATRHLRHRVPTTDGFTSSIWNASYL